MRVDYTTGGSQQNRDVERNAGDLCRSSLQPQDDQPCLVPPGEDFHTHMDKAPQLHNPKFSFMTVLKFQNVGSFQR